MATRNTRNGVAPTIQVYFINADLSGWHTPYSVREGTTVGQFFNQRVGKTADPDAYQIRVNRNTCDQDDELEDGDIMSVTPSKIEGA